MVPGPWVLLHSIPEKTISELDPHGYTDSLSPSSQSDRKRKALRRDRQVALAKVWSRGHA